MTKLRTTTPIPVQLSGPEFIAFIFPHLSMPMRGPKCKLGYHRVFNLILWVLYTGMQWKCLPYLNLDGGFDSRRNRKAIFNAGLVPNIKENPRNRKAAKRGRKRLFNAAIHSLRLCVERTFAWEDKFKRLLLRFEFKQQRHYGMKLMAFTLINLRHFCGA